MNVYDVLGIKEGQTYNDVKANYRKQIKKYHPDISEGFEEKMIQIKDAWDYFQQHSEEILKSAPKGVSSKHHISLFEVF